MDNKITSLYCRVSTIHQKKKENINNQINRLTEYAKEKGYKYEIYTDDGFSAKDTNRPALRRLISDVEDGKIDRVLVTKVDRIIRRIKDLADLLELFEKRNVSFQSLTQQIDTSSAMGRGFLKLLGIFAEMERDMIRERVGEDMKYRAKNGKWNGGKIPFGYSTVKKKLSVNQEEAEIIKKISTKYIELESLRGVTQFLNENGYKTRNNKTWATTSIRRILSNPTYIGKIWYNKRTHLEISGKMRNNPKDEWIISEGSHQPIIDEETFNIVQKKLEQQSREPRRKMSEYLLSGFVRCGKCGGALSGVTYRRNPRVYSYYRCHTNQSKGKSVCEGISIPKDILENIVVKKVLSLTESKEFKVDMKKVLDKFNEEVSLKINPMTEEKNKLIKKNENIKNKKKNLLIALEDGTIDKETYKNRILELDEEFENNQRRIFEIESKLNDNNVETISFNVVYETIKNFKDNWKHLDYLGKKDILWTLMSKVVVKEKEVNVDIFFLPSLFSNFDNARMSMRILYKSTS